MKNKHISEIEIQEYLYEELNSRTEITEHIQQCEICRMKVEEYKQIFELVKEQEIPAFDFNLADAVMNRLPRKKAELTFGKYIVAFILLITTPSVGIIICLFNTSLSDLLTGITPIIFYLIAITMSALLLFQCFDTYRRYKNKMNALNFY